MEPKTLPYITSSAPKRARTPENDENSRGHQPHKMRKLNDLHTTDAALGHESTTSERDYGPATMSPTQTSLPPRASFLGLPRELRDQIYEHLADTEERIVLGWRFVQAYKYNDDTVSLDECFDSAVALHPLSMTSKQMHAEYQDVHLSASEARWTLLVNNLDLEQLILFDNYIDSRVFIAPINWAFDKKCGFSRPDFNVDLKLRFQMDRNAPRSATALCELFASDERENKDTLCALKRLTGLSAEVETKHTSRSTASRNHVRSMTQEGANLITFKLTSLQFFMVVRRGSLGFWTYERMESCWFKPFVKAVRAMRGGQEGN